MFCSPLFSCQISEIFKTAILKNIREVGLNPLSANPTNWSNRLKQFVGNLPTNYLSVFEHFVKLALKGLIASVMSLL